jgi:hypothetical protein
VRELRPPVGSPGQAIGQAPPRGCKLGCPVGRGCVGRGCVRAVVSARTSVGAGLSDCSLGLRDVVVSETE